MNTPRIDDRDWSALTLGEQICQIEVEGYLLLPDLLSPDHVARLKSETAKLETTPVDYSVHQRDVQISNLEGVLSRNYLPIPRRCPSCENFLATKLS